MHQASASPSLPGAGPEKVEKGPVQRGKDHKEEPTARTYSALRREQEAGATNALGLQRKEGVD